ncbi:SDR family oxidoreductase [Sphingomonas quercus]|uniref:NAD(P)H-binding protein n=1 Tax=Sphingomonas quercus TaxID=2842451 RepID=A0ABS6BN61_9SPHN|nr:NAD(P)H-binding protein [Sphingomonas quercus]
MRTLALTGGTGFVGGNLIPLAVGKGFAVRALTRRPQVPRDGVVWIPGSLDDPDALARLCRGADAVIHVAGTINATDRAGFEAGNVRGTMAMIRAARAEQVRRFIHVSSLAAREPDLSDYGRSKRRSERVVAASGLDWTIVRPPAVYGPGDREMLELFRMARRGLVPLPPGGRLSVIAAGDLCRLLLALIDAPRTIGETYEPDDGQPGGWSHREFAQALGAAFGRRVRALSLSSGLLKAGARIDRLLRRDGAKLTADRVRYFCHPDWVARADHHPPMSVWHPATPTPVGLRATADWYQAAGWL